MSSRLAALLPIIGAMFALVTPCISAAPTDAWTFSVEPGIGKSRPAVVLTTKGGPADLITTVTALGKETTGVLSTAIARSTTSLRLTVPVVPRDTYVEVSVSTSSEGGEGFPYKWRTLARPAGQKLMDYKGREEMLPPPDFDKYWARAKKELAAVPAEAKVTRVPDRDSSTGLLYQVQLASVQESQIIGWLFVPRDAYPGGDPETTPTKTFPAVLIAPGYKGDQRPVDRTAKGYITFAVNPRNHGPSRAFWKAPGEHLVYNITDCENYYYKLAFLDCLRAAEFLFSRPEVDTKRVGTEGSSQGGLFSLATAALEPRIACVSAHVIAFSDVPDGSVLATSGGQKVFAELMDEDNTTATLVRKSLSYIDGANMATRVKCPVQINMAGQDPVSPYVCGIVVHNRLSKGTKREFNIAPDAVHEVTGQMRQWSAAWQKQWLGR